MYTVRAKNPNDNGKNKSINYPWMFKSFRHCQKACAETSYENMSYCPKKTKINIFKQISNL